MRHMSVNYLSASSLSDCHSSLCSAYTTLQPVPVLRQHWSTECLWMFFVLRHTWRTVHVLYRYFKFDFRNTLHSSAAWSELGNLVTRN